VPAIVTRPQHEARLWVQRLKAEGMDAIALPLIEIAAAPDAGPVRQAWSRLPDCHAVMFVSANAVRHFFAEKPADVSFAPRAWATGPGTADALGECGVAAAAIDTPAGDAAQFDSESLWCQVAGQLRRGDRVLIVRGGNGDAAPAGRGWLADQLVQAGAEVDQVVSYVRRLPQWSEADRQLARKAAADGSVWLFSSSEAVGHLAALLPGQSWRHARGLATHPRIAQAARDAGFGEVQQCRPAFEDVLASLQSGAMSSQPTPSPDPDNAALPALEPVKAVVTPPHTAARGIVLFLVFLAGAALLSTVLLWQKLTTIQEQLARQSADSGAMAIEARALARQAQENARDAVARQALLETRVHEVAMQRGQLEELIQSLSLSRDENLLVDIDASLRLAQQQTQLTGSPEPLLTALRTADQRLARAAQPRLARLRAAIARDTDRIRAATVTDVPGVLARLDELVRQVDELPAVNALPARQPSDAARKAPPAPAATMGWQQWGAAVMDEARSLVRVSRIDQPEAALLAPEQSFFLRENLKLKLLNARLSLLARQIDVARADVATAAATLHKYFDPASRRTQAAATQLQQVQVQLKSTELPRVEETLAALATAGAGR